jgi:hypothetical protein
MSAGRDSISKTEWKGCVAWRFGVSATRLEATGTRLMNSLCLQESMLQFPIYYSLRCRKKVSMSHRFSVIQILNVSYDSSN